MPMTGFGW